ATLWTFSQGLLLLTIFVSVLTTVPAQQNAAASRPSRPVDECKVKRNRLRVEEELRVALRTLRKSIDEYHMYCQSGLVGPLDRRVKNDGNPPNLEVLMTGVKPPNGSTPIRYLRRIPIDPTTGKRQWGLRSAQDEPTARQWGGQNVFDVYSLSKGKALDRSSY